MILAKLIGNLSINKMPSLSGFDKEVKMSKHIPWRYFAAPHIFTTRNGELGSVIQIKGASFEVKSHSEINQLQSTLSFAVQSLGDEFAVYVTTYRHQQPSRLEGSFPPGFAQEFADRYQAQFEDAQLFTNDIYLTLLLRQGSTKVKKGIKFMERFSLRKNEENAKLWHETRLRQFNMALTNLLTILKEYSPYLLSEQFVENELPTCEMLRFLSILVNGTERNFTYPYQDIASFVTEKRLFFGNDTLHYQGLSRQNDRFGALLSVKTYAPVSLPGLLDAMLAVPFECITTHSFSGIDKNQALNLIDTQTKRLKSTDDAARSQIQQLEQAKDDLASGRINYGFHHNTILVISRKMDALEDQVAQVIKLYQDKRFVVVRETLNLESAFWAQIPGNFKYIRRKAPISSHNFSCFCSLHNYYRGYINKNHLGGALMLAETASKTPFYFNLHERASGRKDDLPKGHTMLIAPSNAGKTVMMTTIDVMYQKYNIRSFFFDRNLGCEIYIRAMDGIYNRLVPGEPTGWNPFQLPDTLQNRKFLRDFLEVLSTRQGETLTASDVNQIADVIDRSYTLPWEKRNLSNMTSFFRLDFSGLDSLSRYLRLPDRTGRAGDRSYLFDNEIDTLSFKARTIGFDMTHWLNEAGDPAEELLPMTMYLFHRIGASLDGQLTGLYLDEGWQTLSNPYWAKKLDEFLVTWRKNNAFLFFASQLPDKIAASPLASALIQGAATHLFLPNPKAEAKDYIGSFKLTAREFEIIKNHSIQSRYFLLKQGHDAAIARFNLNGLENYLSVLSGNAETVALCQWLRETVGEAPHLWLPLFYAKRAL